jgi:hypothetical protein
MAIQRKIHQFRPLVESGYATTRRTVKTSLPGGNTLGYVSLESLHHVTLRIDVAALARHLLEKIVAGRGNTSRMAGGAIRLKINTTQEG